LVSFILRVLPTLPPGDEPFGVEFYGWLLLGSLGLLLIVGVGLTVARVCRRGSRGLGLEKPLLTTSPRYEAGRGSLTFHPESGGGGSQPEREAEMGDPVDVNFASTFGPRQGMGRKQKLPAVGPRRGSWPKSSDIPDHVASTLESRSQSLDSRPWPEARDEATSREVARAALAPAQDEAEGEGRDSLAAELLVGDSLTSGGEDESGGTSPTAAAEDSRNNSDSDSSDSDGGDDLGRPSSGGRAASTRTTRYQSVMETVLEHEPEPPRSIVDLQEDSTGESGDETEPRVSEYFDTPTGPPPHGLIAAQPQHAAGRTGQSTEPAPEPNAIRLVVVSKSPGFGFGMAIRDDNVVERFNPGADGHRGSAEVAGIRIRERVTRVDGREVNGKQELIAVLLRQNDQASVEFTLVDDTRRSFKI
jgi:hypothetical protein